MRLLQQHRSGQVLALPLHMRIWAMLVQVQHASAQTGQLHAIGRHMLGWAKAQAGSGARNTAGPGGITAMTEGQLTNFSYGRADSCG